MRGSAVSVATSMGMSAILLCGCSDGHSVPSGPVSTADAGKAAFNEAKAIEKIYHAGYTNISSPTRDPDGAWRARATRRGSAELVVVSVTKDGPVVTR
jgi:hypothetical protein